MAFIRWKTNRTGGAQAYLVQSYRENGKPKQRTLAYLGDAAALTPEHVAELKRRYPDQSIDWDAIKPRVKPLTDPQALSDADLLRKMRHIRLERNLGTYTMSWALRDAGLKDFNRKKLAELEKLYAGVKTPTQEPDAALAAALRIVFKIPEPVVPRKVEPVQQNSAPQMPKPVSSSNFPPPDDIDSVEKVEDIFFQALLTNNAGALRDLLARDFILVDVFKGAEIDKASFIAVLETGQLKFEKIERPGSRIRRYKNVAVVVGQTHMAGQFAGNPFAVGSRYTHVYVQMAGPWLMVSAQGTPISS